MTTFGELEILQARLRSDIAVDTPPPPPPKKLPSYITLKGLLEKEPRTIDVRTGLSREEFEYVLHLLKENPEPRKRGPKLLELEVRLLITLQWLQLNQTYEKIGVSFGIDSNRVQTSISSIWDRLKDCLVKDLIPKSHLITSQEGSS